MRVSQQPAYVLHTRAYRETSLLLEVFTRNFGRLTLLAKGIRTLKSRQRTAMLRFSPLSIGWSGKGELPILAQSEHDGPVSLLSGRALVCGFYANELMIKLLHRHDPHTMLFDAYESLMSELRAGTNIEVGLRIFEKSLLRELGYALDLEREADGETRVKPEFSYRYVPSYGVVRADQPGNSEQTVSGHALLALAREEFQDPAWVGECKRLMRDIIREQLGTQKLQSRSMLTISRG